VVDDKIEGYERRYAKDTLGGMPLEAASVGDRLSMPLIINRKGLDACCPIARMLTQLTARDIRGAIRGKSPPTSGRRLEAVSARAFHVSERNIPAVIFKVGRKCKPSRLVKDKSIEDKFQPCHASASWRFRPGCKSTSTQDEQMHVVESARYHHGRLGLALVALPCRSPWVCLRYGSSFITLFDGNSSEQETNEGKAKGWLACMPRSESLSGKRSGGPREAKYDGK
jgi:hypothetical protein